MQYNCTDKNAQIVQWLLTGMINIVVLPLCEQHCSAMINYSSAAISMLWQLCYHVEIAVLTIVNMVPMHVFHVPTTMYCFANAEQCWDTGEQ